MRSYIIGYPLNKPRSVPLWKSYFQKHKMYVKMTPLEIKPIDLKKFILSKKNDNLFLASAVTMPFKKDIVLYCKYGDKITQKCRSANLIIRYKKNYFVIIMILNQQLNPYLKKNI